MKQKTNTLLGGALDWAVATAKNAGTLYIEKDGKHELATACYSSNWESGGPIIEAEGFQICCNSKAHRHWVVEPYNGCKLGKESHGPTLLIAAMRCYVVSKLGDEIELPEYLCRTIKE